MFTASPPRRPRSSLRIQYAIPWKSPTPFIRCHPRRRLPCQDNDDNSCLRWRPAIRSPRNLRGGHLSHPRDVPRDYRTARGPAAGLAAEERYETTTSIETMTSV
jgi:hypothetical protein